MAGIPIEEIRKLVRIAKEPVSLEAPIRGDGEGRLGEFIEDKRIPKPFEEATRADLRLQVRKTLAALPPREEMVLRLRFGIGERRDHTLQELGDRFMITRERIRQIELKALRKLRSHAGKQKRHDRASIGLGEGAATRTSERTER